MSLEGGPPPAIVQPEVAPDQIHSEFKAAFSISETSRILSLSQSKVRDLAYRGDIGSVKVGRRLLIPRWAIDQFVDAPKQALDRISVDPSTGMSSRHPP